MIAANTTRMSLRILLAVILLFLYGPLVHPLLMAVSETGQVGTGMSFTLDRFGEMFGGSMVGPALRNSLIAAICTGIITPILALLGAFAVREFRPKRAIVMLMVVPLFIPAVTMGLASALFLQTLGIPSSLVTIVLVHIVWALPFAFLIVLTAMASFNTVFLEAAHMSGANRWRAFRDVEFPHIRPGLTGAALFSAIISFNETIRTTLVQGPNNTIQTYIWSQFLQVGLSPQLFALMASLIVLTVGLVLVMILLSLRQPREAAPSTSASAGSPESVEERPCQA